MQHHITASSIVKSYNVNKPTYCFLYLLCFHCGVILGSSDRIFGTIFAQTFVIFNSTVRIRRTLSLSKLTFSATARTPNLVFSNHMSHCFNVVIVNSCAWPAWAIIIFHAFSAFRKSFVPLKNA
jgi:hypothetical protein